MSKKSKKKKKSARKQFPWFHAAVLFGLLIVIVLAVAILSKPTPVARAVSVTPHAASVQAPIADPIATPSAAPAPAPTLAPVTASRVQPVVGKSGAAGKNGAAGPVGASGPAGKDGVNGVAGVGIKSIACNPDGSWAVTLTDGTTQAVTGPCIGANGQDGAQGSPGSAPVGWTYRDAYGFRYTCVRVSYYTDQSPQYTCTQG